MHSDVLEALINIGALDSLERNRKMLLSNLDYLLEIMNYSSTEEMDSLFNDAQNNQAELNKLTLKPCLPWTFTEELKEEKQALGFYLDRNPLTFYTPELKHLGNLINLKELSLGRVEKEFWVAAYIYDYWITLDDKNNKKAEIQIEDKTETLHLFVNTRKYIELQHLLDRDCVLLLKMQRVYYEEQTRYFIQKAFSLEKLRQNFTKQLILDLSNQKNITELLTKLKDILNKNTGEASVHLKITFQSQESVRQKTTLIELTQKTKVSGDLLDALSCFIPLENISLKYSADFWQQMNNLK